MVPLRSVGRRTFAVIRRLLQTAFPPLASKRRRTAPAQIVERLEDRRLLHGGDTHAADLALLDAAGTAVLRVNAGGPAYTDTAGLLWAGDAGFVGGKRVRAKFAVTGSDNPILFANRRLGNFAFAGPVANGTYELTLGFVDTVKKSGKRLFGVAAEG